MLDVFMIREVIKIDIDQIVEIEGFNLVVEYNMNRIMDIDQGMNKIIEMTTEEEILEGMSEYIKIRNLKEGIIEMDI